MLKQIITVLTVTVILAGAADAGPREDGNAAFKSGDYLTAVRMWRLAADQGDARGQALLGRMYAEGKGVPKDSAEAVKWFRLAADQGDVGGQNGLGKVYADGVGVPQDYVESAKWYRLAADQGHVLAQYILGAMYAEGISGVPKDYVLAYMWFNLSAAKGNGEAAKHRDRIATTMTRDQLAEAQRLSREWKPTN